jgi:hypothetical protein
VAAQTLCRQPDELALLVRHCGITFSSRPNSCSARRSNRLAWTVRSGCIVGLRR